MYLEAFVLILQHLQESNHEVFIWTEIMVTKIQYYHLEKEINATDITNSLQHIQANQTPYHFLH